MFDGLIRLFYTSRNDRLLTRYAGIVAAVNALEPQIQALADGDFPGRTAALKERLANGAALDDQLPEAFALAR